MDPETHRQVPVKVNALVDEGVAELVCALNDASDRVLTLDSCEGSHDHRRAHVYFAFGERWQELANLVDRMAVELRSRDMFECRLSLEWFGSSGRPRALLSVPREHVTAVATALRQLRP